MAPWFGCAKAHLMQLVPFGGPTNIHIQVGRLVGAEHLYINDNTCRHPKAYMQAIPIKHLS